MRRLNGYLFFWSEWPSNWTPSPFTLDGITYGCVEQYMMAEKARLFGDVAAEQVIMASDDPAEQKAMGRQIRGYDDDKWAAVRYDVVLRATIEKYRQNPALLKALLDTGDDVLVEASPHDRVWGIGMRKTDKGIENPKNWRGQNLLGKAITEAKRLLKP